jgi:hypothetical protein
MSDLGQSRHFAGLPMISGLHSEADIVTTGRHVSKVPITDFTSDGNPVKTRLALPSDPSYGML